MFRKSILASLCIIAFAFAAFAQSTAPVRGRVEMTDADGKKVGVAGALIEVFRTDQKGNPPSAKTDKKGGFSFAGLPLGGTFVLSVSGPGIAPEIYPNVKAGREDILINTVVGDGKKWTEEEVRAALKNPASGGSQEAEGTKSAEEKKKDEEYAKKLAEFKEKKAKVEGLNSLMNKVLKEGNDAKNVKNYDLAIAKYEEGINADPTHPGAPVLLTNKSVVLKLRGVDRYNSGMQSEGKSDFEASKDAAKAAIELLKTLPQPTEASELTNFSAYKLNAAFAYASAMRLFVIKVDQSQTSQLNAAYQDYIDFETDPVKKSAIQLERAQALMDSYDYKLATVEFQKVLEASPNNVDALFGAGLSAWTIAYEMQDKYKNASSQEKAKMSQSEFIEMYQLAANYLGKFISLAPTTHKNIAAAKETLESLKISEKITPKK